MVEHGGGVIDLTGNRATQQAKNRDCYTVSSSRWASQLKNSHYHVSVGSFSLLTGLATFATSFNAAPPPPPLRPWTSKVLDCCTGCTSSDRRFATCSLSVTNQRFIYCSAASSTRLNNSPGLFDASVQCFALVGKVNNDSPVLETAHPVLTLPSRVSLSHLHIPRHHSFW